MDEAISKADIVVTATGNKDIVTADLGDMKIELSCVILVTLIMRYKLKH